MGARVTQERIEAANFDGEPLALLVRPPDGQATPRRGGTGTQSTLLDVTSSSH